MKDGVQFHMQMRITSLRRPRSVDGLELGHFTLLFSRGWQANVQKVITHVHSPWVAYNGLYGDAPPERGTFCRLQVYKGEGI